MTDEKFLKSLHINPCDIGSPELASDEDVASALARSQKFWEDLQADPDAGDFAAMEEYLTQIEARNEILAMAFVSAMCVVCGLVCVVIWMAVRAA